MKLYPLRKQLLFPDQHCYLNCADGCYFAEMYLCNRRKGIRPAVLSLKRSNLLAINYFAEQLSEAVPPDWAARYTFVPMPRSSSLNNALRSVLQNIGVKDWRDLLLQKRMTPSSHGGWRPPPVLRASLLYVNESVSEPRPSTVVILDDVVTTGSHFRAAKLVLRQRWPGLKVLGLFLARVCARRERCFARGLNTLRPTCLMGSEGPLFTPGLKRA